MASPLVTTVAAGEKMDYTPGSAVVAGAVVALGNGVGVVEGDISATGTGILVVEGIARFPKATTSGSALATLCTKVYWDAVNSVVTTTSGSNKVAGYTAEVVDDDDATVLVKLARA